MTKPKTIPPTWLDDHFDMLKSRILTEANELAKKEEREVGLQDLTIITMRYAPGDEYPETDIPFWRKMAYSITGFTLLLGFLAITFGFIAAFMKDTELAKGAWDIAKIFAGAIVGSAGATLNLGKK